MNYIKRSRYGRISLQADRDESERGDRDERALDEVLKVAHVLAQDPDALVGNVEQAHRKTNEYDENVDNAQVDKEVVGERAQTPVVQVDDDHDDVAHEAYDAHGEYRAEEQEHVIVHFAYFLFAFFFETLFTEQKKSNCSDF
jgi:hypothetical protein